ncbi:sensor histidine kinase KdpD [Clostridium sp. LIBA-8841]|uniref:sensor histidine kinase KdpD n=1 Tax=Clostridium sp. LIBA-8841 TaxID=2987530 RepID=UPI002AC51C6C|nr:sensor histidine kinase KdpD [Clostridium sp. LIBA-8841]MDZ5253434.1 sensor histidine kinase KdpD [Clostridium sp. LIBA-8841]
MRETRPNPEKILKEINKNERDSKKGKLKIFFGYAAGVGKTYAMLEAAHSAKDMGLDVVVGYVEPHTRPETIALLEGLELLPNLEISYREMILKEFNLDMALERKPDLIIVDELAHTNVKGLRHEKRYIDIEELLDAGIDVYTTLNVQHIESLNDVVASITNIVVKERIPDRIFKNAFQIELIDVDPSVLMERLNEGKIYVKKQAKKALKNFFIRENLVALRELALRETANSVNKEVMINKSENAYHTNEHILVCLSSSPSNSKVIRTAARMAEAFHGKFTALFVETTSSKELKEGNIGRLREHVKLAKDLGAKIETVYGDDVAYQVSEFSKISSVSKVIIGRTKKKRHPWSRLGIVDRLIELAPELDVYIIPDEEETTEYINKIVLNKEKITTKDSFKTLGILIMAIVVSIFFENLGFSEANIIIVFILGVLIIAKETYGRIYGVLSSLFSVLLFNFFFTEPKFTLDAYDTSYIVTFLIMLISALITSTLTNKVKVQANKSAITAYRTNILLESSSELGRCSDLEEIILKSQEQINRLVKKPVVIYKLKNGQIESIYNYKFKNGSELSDKYINLDEYGVVIWSINNKKYAGKGTDTLPGAKAMYIPILSHEDIGIVIGVILEEGEELEEGEKSLLIAMINQISFVIDNYILEEAKKRALMQAENEKFRANLLRAVSHDLRTPLTSISGSASSLLNNNFDEETKRKLTLDIYDDSVWLINLVENLLSVSRIDNGNINLNKEAQLVEEIISEALQHVNRNVCDYDIEVDLEDELLMINADVRLIIQVIINIVDNAIKYTEKGSKIKISAFPKGDNVIIEIADNGKGISKKDKEHIFDMFFTSKENSSDSRRGLGLGLALCKSIINVHQGEIYVKNNKPRGTIIGFSLQRFEVNEDEVINFSY